MKGMKIREPKRDLSGGNIHMKQEDVVRLKGDSVIERATLHSVSKDRGKIVVDPKTGMRFRVMA